MFQGQREASEANTKKKKGKKVEEEEKEVFDEQQLWNTFVSPVLVQPHGPTCSPIIGTTSSIHSKSRGAEARVCRW